MVDGVGKKLDGRGTWSRTGWAGLRGAGEDGWRQ